MTDAMSDRAPVDEAPSPKKRPRPDATLVRSRLASALWLAARVIALVLAVAALCVALELNRENGLIEGILDLAGVVDFGSFKTFDGDDAEKYEALVNYGVAALIWLGLGKLAERVVRP